MKQKLALLLALLIALSQMASVSLAESLLERLQNNQENREINEEVEESGILLQLVSIGEQPEIIIEEHAGGTFYAGQGNPEGKFFEHENICCKRTNLIPVTPGDQLAYKGHGEYSEASVIWLDEDKQYISDLKISSEDEFTRVLAPEKAEYVWFQSFAYTTKPYKVILEVEWLLCQEAESKYQESSYLNLSETYDYRIGQLESTLNELIGIVTAMDQSDPLYGKKIVYDGDSICSGVSGVSFAYPQLIAEMTDGSFKNLATGDTRLCKNEEDPSLVDNLSSLPEDGDLYCFEGGILDYWDHTPIGECDPYDYFGEVDPTTVCGAVETIFRHCLEKLPGKPVCFIISHKIQNTAYTPNRNGDTFKDFRDAMVAVCEKYSIPYYDAYSESGLNGWNETQNDLFLNGATGKKSDGMNPNTDGYKHFYVPQLLDLFRRIMPVE